MTYVLAAERVCPPGRPAPGWVAIADGLIAEVGSHIANAEVVPVLDRAVGYLRLEAGT